MVGYGLTGCRVAWRRQSNACSLLTANASFDWSPIMLALRVTQAARGFRLNYPKRVSASRDCCRQWSLPIGQGVRVGESGVNFPANFAARRLCDSVYDVFGARKVGAHRCQIQKM